MKATLIAAVTFAGACLPAAAVHAQSTPAVDETRKTVAAVTAVDKHWSQAEMHGDTAYIDQLLLPEYRSISSNGVAHPKSAILASARKNIGSTNGAAAADAYRKEHPSRTSVVLEHDTAIFTYYSEKLGPDNGVMGSDVFVYIDGHWHALYSQHSTAG